MKKVLLFTTVFFMLVSMTSCKKLLGLDPESLLTKAPWQGDKMEIYLNGSLAQIETIDNMTLELFKKTHRYTMYKNNVVTEKGDWSYNEDTKKITFDADTGQPYVFDLIKLDKKNLELEIKSVENGDEILIKLSFRRE